jgi:UDP-glucose 4-epimerase
MKILMTGGNGFLGRAVRTACAEQSHEFISYDMASGKDILDKDSFYLECSEKIPDVVIHAAAVADLYQSDADMDKNFSINVMGTYYIARICALLKIPLIYISTCCAYGNVGDRVNLINENTLPIPTEVYAWSKLAGEKALGCSALPDELKGLILRLGTFYGPGMREALFNAVAIRKVLDNETIQVHGSGEQSRRYIYVSDVAEAIIKACEIAKYNTIPILNIIGREEISVNQTIGTVETILGKQATVEYMPERIGQIMRQPIDGRLAEQSLKWEPKVDYFEGMKRSIEWVKNGSRPS